MTNTEEKNNFSEKLLIGLKNIELLINYAAEQGIIVKSSYIQAFTNFKEIEKNKSWTAANEAEFWIVYAQISKLLKPVNIENIKLVEKKENKKTTTFSKFWFKKPSLTKRIVRNYIWITFIFIILTIVLQTQSLIGFHLTSEVKQADQQLIKIEEQMQNLLLLTSSNPDDRKSHMELNKLELELQHINSSLETRIYRLANWNDIFYIFNPRFYSGGNLLEETSSLSHNQNTEDGPPMHSGVLQASINNQTIVDAIDNYKILSSTLNIFILPILYGILGALIYTLRSLKSNISTIKYLIVNGRIKYLLHIAIGALAGFIINLLFRTDNVTSEGIISFSFSPLALSFIAGYSVEIIFNGMDKLINLINSSIAGKETAKKKEDEK